MHKNKTYLSPEELELQQHLSPEILRKLNTELYDGDSAELESDRPTTNFFQLLDWANTKFSSYLKDYQKSPINKFIHNRIIIDGQFMRFCKENNIEVNCIYQNSIISWQGDFDHEKYFMQGVFLISGHDFDFIHCALMHKGVENEDEIGFFVLVSEKNYQSYINFRNKFDQWVQERDRSNLHIRVIDGDDIPYTKDQTWDDLFFPTDLKKEIRSLVENFLSSKQFYIDKKIPWKRGMLLWGQAGNGKSSLVRTLISEYDFKPVTIAAEGNNDTLREAFSYAEDQSPSLLYFEDLDSLLERSLDLSTLLNLLDGISSKNGLLVVATANNIKKLKTSLTQRPSRFDRKFEIPPPTFEMAVIYLKKWFGSIITDKKCQEIATQIVRHELSFAYVKELYISSMFEALSKNRKIPTVKDIDFTLNRLIKDKNVSNGTTINTDKYFG